MHSFECVFHAESKYVGRQLNFRHVLKKLIYPSYAFDTRMEMVKGALDKYNIIP